MYAQHVYNVLHYKCPNKRVDVHTIIHCMCDSVGLSQRSVVRVLVKGSSLTIPNTHWKVAVTQVDLSEAT